MHLPRNVIHFKMQVIPQKYADAQALILLGTELVGLKGLTSKTST